jgi:hypothetical protein
MTRQPQAANRPHREEAHAAMARVFGVDVQPGAQQEQATAPEPPAGEAERREALGRVFGTEA